MENSNLKDNLEYQDLVYFGYDHEPKEAAEAREAEKEFMETLKEMFPTAEFKDAYDYIKIKGYRREVYLPEGSSEAYYTWIFAFGWYDFSLTMGIMMRSPDKKEEVAKYIKLAKSEYPQNFKTESDDSRTN
jgi:hypothetical protein